MQTQCPHCNTRFRVTQTQVDAADGMLRCGICKEIFNAFEVANQHEYQTSLLSEDATDIVSNSEADEPTASTAAVDTATAETKPQSKDEFDFFDDNELSASSIIPDDLRDTYSQQPKLIATLLWSIGILFLITTLMLEYIWFNRNQFNQIPQLQAGIEKLCQHFSCKQMSMRDASKIELLDRNVYSHPKEKNALIIDLTIQNNADFAQPYPVMQVDFSNVRGNVVAARRFFPKDYLHSDVSDNQLIAPNKSIKLSMEIQDPGKSALTYEFSFL